MAERMQRVITEVPGRIGTTAELREEQHRDVRALIKASNRAARRGDLEDATRLSEEADELDHGTVFGDDEDVY